MSEKVNIIGQIAEVKRELALRSNTYPRLVAASKMRQGDADLNTARMEAVLGTLMFCQANEADIRAFIAARREKAGGGVIHDPRQLDIEDMTGARR